MLGGGQSASCCHRFAPSVYTVTGGSSMISLSMSLSAPRQLFLPIATINFAG
jgi:hypothetical protein